MSHVWCSLANSKRASLWRGRRRGLWRRFLFLKPFSRRWRLMVIGLQSAPVRALIWVEDRPVSSRTTSRILVASVQVTFFWVYRFTFLSHNSQDLLRNVKWLSYCVQPWQRWRVARGLACAAQQSGQVQREKAFLPLPSGDYDSVTAWRTMTRKPYFCADFTFLCLWS